MFLSQQQSLFKLESSLKFFLTEQFSADKCGFAKVEMLLQGGHRFGRILHEEEKEHLSFIEGKFHHDEILGRMYNFFNCEVLFFLQRLQGWTFSNTWLQ